MEWASLKGVPFWDSAVKVWDPVKTSCCNLSMNSARLPEAPCAAGGSCNQSAQLVEASYLLHFQPITPWPETSASAAPDSLKASKKRTNNTCTSTRSLSQKRVRGTRSTGSLCSSLIVEFVLIPTPQKQKQDRQPGDRIPLQTPGSSELSQIWGVLRYLEGYLIGVLIIKVSYSLSLGTLSRVPAFFANPLICYQTGTRPCSHMRVSGMSSGSTNNPNPVNPNNPHDPDNPYNR